jgi:hypothetical protein
MNAINERIQNPLFFLSFFGAALFLFASVVVYSRGLAQAASGSS